VVANLLGNALEHGAPDGPVVLACRGDPETLDFEVSNRGPPIPPGFRPLLFEPFRRGPGAEKASRGLGLGLFIARQIVLAHGGAIEVRSDEEHGTAFAVHLPRRPPAAG
ncbi:MAG TPA: sensor histidine kinase, partial [Anaeromyxobacteraceae bacterium]